MSSRGTCAGIVVFFHTEVVSESKIVREMLCFTIETAVGGCQGRTRETAVADMVAYARLSSDRPSIGKCNRKWLNALYGRFQVVLARWWWHFARGKCGQRIAARIETAVSRWLWVVGFRRCARGKCIQRVASRIVMVVSRWLGVVALLNKGELEKAAGRNFAFHINGENMLGLGRDFWEQYIYIWI